jgi:glucose/arabinose dehydrogenase
MGKFKQIFLVLYGVLFVLILVLAGQFFYKNLRGIGPVVLAPPYDISQKIEEASQSQAEVNKTGLPLKLPPGFSISIFAKNLEKPRVMAFDPAGNLVVSLLKAGKVVALPDYNKDGTADKTVVLAEGLNRPHGIAFRCLDKDNCKLYVAENDKISVFDYNTKELKTSLKIELLALPSDGRHFTRTILFVPASIAADYQTASSSLNEEVEEKLLISVGSSCDTCEEKDWRRAKILIADVDGSNLHPFASGLRNSVFMALNSATGEVWATEMGRDYLGDELPPDEINIIRDGNDYGWPYCYGNNVHDTVYDKDVETNPCVDKTPAYISLPAHSAPLGLAFFPSQGWPAEYQNDLLVSFHGSWNRSQPRGYEIVRFRLDKNGQFEEVDENGQPIMHNFISGWLTADNRALGRPVDIKILPNGIIFVSDDKAGVIYRLVYQQAKSQKLAASKKPGQKAPALSQPKPTASTSQLLVRLNSPEKNQVIKSPLVVNGQARGVWFFEGLVGVSLLDGQGQQIAETEARALADWKTVDYVPFRAVLEFDQPQTATGTLLIKRLQPPAEEAKEFIFKAPIRFATTTQ